MSKHRLAIVLAASAAAISTAAVMAVSGTAQTAPTAVHLVATPQKGVGFTPHRRPRQGDRLGFGGRVSGDDQGFDRAACTIVGPGGLLCTIQLKLARGQLSAQGLIPERAKGTSVPITGGTGAYDGARGTALVTDTSNGTEIAISLKP